MYLCSSMLLTELLVLMPFVVMSRTALLAGPKKQRVWSLISMVGHDENQLKPGKVECFGTGVKRL